MQSSGPTRRWGLDHLVWGLNGGPEIGSGALLIGGDLWGGISAVRLRAKPGGGSCTNKRQLGVLLKTDS